VLITVVVVLQAMATEVMCQLAGLLVEMLLEEEMNDKELCTNLIESAMKSAACSYRVGVDKIRQLFVPYLGSSCRVKITTVKKMEKEVLGSLYDDIMEWENASQGV